MANPNDVDTAMEDDYDEEADSDFDAGKASDEIISSTSEEDDDQNATAQRARPKPQIQVSRKVKSPEVLELDSGDEATIQERNRANQKHKSKGRHPQEDDSDVDEQGWRARTRAMRQIKRTEKKSAKLSSVRESTIDVNQIWEAMNRSDGLENLSKPAATMKSGVGIGPADEQKENVEPSPTQFTDREGEELGKDQDLQEDPNDMITIDEPYEFAREMHTRKITVPRSSAQAQLWLSQRSHYNSDPRFPGDEPVRRPLRKISRFDPNINNLGSFKKNWDSAAMHDKVAKVHKLNTVEKSKMDWAAHVDEEGLQDELSEHAKAKEGYLGRMDFLVQVEQRKEEEAMGLRAKG